MNKKGVELTFNTIVYSVIALVLIAIGIFLITEYVISPSQQFAVQIDTLKDPSCKAKGQLLQARGSEFLDEDDDLRPDLSCDICIPGDNDKDMDTDNVPDACDLDPKDPNIGFCAPENDIANCKDSSCRGSSACKKGSLCGPTSWKITEISEDLFICKKES